MFYGEMARRIKESGDALWGFRAIAARLGAGDVLFGNLETLITKVRKREAGVDPKYEYSSPIGMGRALKEAGYDCVSLAHNHTYDFGDEGVECTMRELSAAGVKHFGVGCSQDEAAIPAVVRTGSGAKVGFLGYTTMHNILDPRRRYMACFPELRRVQRDIAALRQHVDTVVVSCHTGIQENPYPAPETRDLARAAINGGAAVFLGHHPHVPQGWERIGEGLAFYSLGDFVTPPHNAQTRRTFFARIRVCGPAALEHEIVPCYISDDCRTLLAEGALAGEIVAHIESISRDIAEGRSADLHFETVRRRFRSQYVASWRYEWKTGGARAFARKLRGLRAYHVQMMARLLLGKALGRAR